MGPRRNDSTSPQRDSSELESPITPPPEEAQEPLPFLDDSDSETDSATDSETEALRFLVDSDFESESEARVSPTTPELPHTTPPRHLAPRRLVFETPRQRADPREDPLSTEELLVRYATVLLRRGEFRGALALCSTLTSDYLFPLPRSSRPLMRRTSRDLHALSDAELLALCVRSVRSRHYAAARAAAQLLLRRSYFR